MRRALAQEAALAGVGALGVLADHDHVDAALGQDERPLVDVLVEREAHLQQQAPLDHAGRHVGGADRAEQDGVEGPQLLEHLVGQDRAVPQVAGAAEVVVDGVEVDAGGARDLEGLGHHLGADAVSSDDCDAMGQGARSPYRRCSRTRKPPTSVDGRKRTRGCRRALRNGGYGKRWRAHWAGV